MHWRQVRLCRLATDTITSDAVLACRVRRPSLCSRISALSGARSTWGGMGGADGGGGGILWFDWGASASGLSKIGCPLTSCEPPRDFPVDVITVTSEVVDRTRTEQRCTTDMMPRMCLGIHGAHGFGIDYGQSRRKPSPSELRLRSERASRLAYERLRRRATSPVSTQRRVLNGPAAVIKHVGARALALIACFQFRHLSWTLSAEHLHMKYRRARL